MLLYQTCFYLFLRPYLHDASGENAPMMFADDELVIIVTVIPLRFIAEQHHSQTYLIC